MVPSAAFALALFAAAGPPAEVVGPPVPLLDRNGFPLPAGAVARFGDHARRHRPPGEWANFSDDDKLLARPLDGLVQILDLDRNRDVTPGYLKDHPNAVLRFLPDGRHFVFSPHLKRCEVRDPVSGEPACGFEVPAAWAEVMPPSADGTRALVRYRNSDGYFMAALADLSGREAAVRTYKGYSSDDRWAVSGDGRRLFRGWERGVEVYDAATGERSADRTCRNRGYSWLFPSADGGKLVAGWEGGTMTFAVTAEGIGEPQSSGFALDAEVAFTPDGRAVQAGIGVTDAKGSFTKVEADHDRTNPPRVHRFSRSGARCVDLFNDRPPVVWDPLTGKTVVRLDQLPAAAGVSVGANGAVSVRHADRSVRVYAADGKPGTELLGRASRQGSSVLATTADGTVAVEYDGREKKLFTYDLATGGGTAWPQEFADPPQAVRPDPTGKRAYLSGGDYAGLFELSTGRRVRGGLDASASVGFSPDGRLLATLGRKGVKVYEVASGKERATLALPATDFDLDDGAGRYRRGWDEDEPTPRGQVQFSADGGRLAVFWVTGRMTVWDTADGGVVYREPRLWSATRIAALRPDGDWVATTTRTQRRIALRNFADPRADRGTVILPDLKSAVTGLAFTADGRRLISAHDDGTAVAWDVDALVKQPPTAEPDAAEVLWPLLGSADAKLAGKAVAGLAARPDLSVPLLAEQLKPVSAPDADGVKAAVKGLGSDDFKTREAAEKHLRALGELAADDLSAAEATAGAEAADRIRRLLDALAAEELDPERLRAVRAVEVLERIGTPAAKTVLEKAGGGAPAAALTREANRAVERLKERGR